MSKEQERTAILNAVIVGYRKVLRSRYTHSNLRERAGFPESFDEERVNSFREYFLANLYPPPEKRSELNEAFESLEDYIKHPDKLLRILIDSSSIVFKYGRHLPKLLNAGMKALRSFQIALKFERGLVDNAIRLGLEAPYDDGDIDTLIGALPRKEIDQFIESNEVLFGMFHDRKLVGRAKDIFEVLIGKMKKRPKVYSEAEVRALEIGQAIIVEGDLLFEQLEKEEQELIIGFVIDLERGVLEDIFS